MCKAVCNYYWLLTYLKFVKYRVFPIFTNFDSDIPIFDLFYSDNPIFAIFYSDIPIFDTPIAPPLVCVNCLFSKLRSFKRIAYKRIIDLPKISFCREV